jgi:hypothetical protein
LFDPCFGVFDELNLSGVGRILMASNIGLIPSFLGFLGCPELIDFVLKFVVLLFVRPAVLRQLRNIDVHSQAPAGLAAIFFGTILLAGLKSGAELFKLLNELVQFVGFFLPGLFRDLVGSFGGLCVLLRFGQCGLRLRNTLSRISRLVEGLLGGSLRVPGVVHGSDFWVIFVEALPQTTANVPSGFKNRRAKLICPPNANDLAIEFRAFLKAQN